MSDDEVFVTAVATLVGGAGWMWWFMNVRGIPGFRAPGRVPIAVIAATLSLCGVLLVSILLTAAASDVREAPLYVFMYLVLGLAWLRLAHGIFPLLGLHPRDDMFERRNQAAVPAWIGAMLGVTFCYAGGNIGDGPGWWVVVFSAGLATAALVLTWFGFGQYTRLVESIAIGRDYASGWRLGALLASTGLIYGFAVTGDWVSAEATVIDFVRRGAPALVIIAGGLFVERAFTPTPVRPVPPMTTAAVAPAIAYLAVAVLAIRFVSVPQ